MQTVGASEYFIRDASLPVPFAAFSPVSSVLPWRNGIS